MKIRLERTKGWRKVVQSDPPAGRLKANAATKHRSKIAVFIYTYDLSIGLYCNLIVGYWKLDIAFVRFVQCFRGGAVFESPGLARGSLCA